MTPSLVLWVWLVGWLVLSCGNAYLSARFDLKSDDVFPATGLFLVWPLLLALAVVLSPVALAHWLGKRGHK